MEKNINNEENIIDNEEVSSSQEVEPKQDNYDGYVMKLPESEKPEEKVIEPNKPPHFMMRIAGGLIDFCLLLLSVFGLYRLFMLTPMQNELMRYANLAVEVQDSYKLKKLVPDSDETYGHKVYENETGYEEYTTYNVYHDDEQNLDYVIINNEERSQDIEKAYASALKADEYYKSYTFNYRLIYYGIVVLAGSIAEAVFLLAVPLLNKNRATLGKLAAGTMLINSKYQVRAKWYQIVGRYFWQLIFESALPFLFLSSWTMFVMPAALFIITLLNKNRRTLHDFVSRTQVIDKKSFVPLEEQ